MSTYSGSMLFQSTHPARGATLHLSAHRGHGRHFNPRTPRGVRHAQLFQAFRFAGISIHAPREGCDQGAICAQWRHVISIHAPREGCDLCWLFWWRSAYEFQSTHPARGATGFLGAPLCARKISIHAPREGCDGQLQGLVLRLENFNPRTPRGVRQRAGRALCIPCKFQSTHPARGATLLESVEHSNI